MSAPGLESIEHTVQLTHTWINDLDARLGWDNKHRAYHLLRTVLQAIRDWLKVEEAAKFGAQLPELLRGVYYEHWQPARAPVKRRSKVDFVARVDQAFHADPLIFTSEAITTVFQFLSDKITPGEIASCLTGGRQSAVANLLPCGMRLLNFGVFELRQLE